MIYYFVINNILLDKNSTLDVSDDVFRLIRRCLLRFRKLNI